MKIGKRLSLLRVTEHNYTLRQLEKLSGVSNSMLCMYEHDLKSPTLRVLEKIAKAYKIKTWKLIRYLEE